MGLVAEFYGGDGGLLRAIRTALSSAGLDPDTLRPADLAPVDEFHIRGREATIEIAESLDVDAGGRVVDLGSGLGGPARALAELTGCSVTGVDLTPEFCEVATALSAWTDMAERTTFYVGDATATGLPDASMDAAVTIHVAMNVPDKAALYAEAARVLRPGGRFVAYDVLQGEGGEVRYPVPWAMDPTTSHLVTADRMQALLAEAGFHVVSQVDSSDQGLEWFQRLRARIEQEGPPPFTFAAFLGERFGEMAANQVANLSERRIRTVMFVCRLP